MKDLKEKFLKLFGIKHEKEFFSPGRVNLIGEHTDYNGGNVFPCAIDKGTYALVKKRDDNRFRMYSENFAELGIMEFTLDKLENEKEHDWANYPKGVIKMFIDAGQKIDSGFDIVFYGNIPNGAGLSSSASIEILTAVVLKDLFNLDIDMIEMVKLGQKTENLFIGVNSGIMDQFASVFGQAGKLMRLDCRSREFEYFPFNPEGYKLVLLDSKVKHELASSAYNDRRHSCENVVATLQKKYTDKKIETLRDADWAMLESVKGEVSEEDYLRATFVLGEKDRVLAVCDALEKGDYETVGKKMYETHHGLSKEYEVSCEELDYLNELAKENNVTGSRIMGGGFGGCTINLVKEELYDAFVANASEKYEAKYGRKPGVYNVVIGDGSRKIC